ncbi:hypothetical protein [Ekhidna sp.]|uniref:Cbp1 family collagen-binding glycoprotein adhesin n=1 Tax=Ekhidna sp. TaxID=2608089 RepID=UPI003298F9E8
MRFSIITLMLAFLPISCGDKAETESLQKEIAALKNENKALKNKQRLQEASISGYRRTLEEIDFNLNKIELSWSLIHELKSESPQDKAAEERIKSRIHFIDNIISNTNLKIQVLDRNLSDLRKDSQNKSDEILTLDRSLKASARTLIQKEQDHNNKRKELEIEIEDLEKIYIEQKAYTEELRKMLNRAYYFTGTSKELKKSGIVNQEGGFIGIGRVKVLNAQNDEVNFQQIEKDQTHLLNLNAAKIKLITTHPKNSFSIQYQNGNGRLTIIDKKEFWKAGNYLIIQLN